MKNRLLIITLWHSIFLFALQFQLFVELKKSYGFVDYIIFSLILRIGIMFLAAFYILG